MAVFTLARHPLKALGKVQAFHGITLHDANPMSAMMDHDFSKCPFLLVEDDANDVYLLQTAFPKAGLQNALHVVNSGDDAVAYLAGMNPFNDRQRHPWPSVVLLDLNLPGKNGFEVLEWLAIQPFRPQLVVIVMTNSNSKADADRAMEMKADLFIIKPAKFDALVELTRCLHYWLRLNYWSPDPTSATSPDLTRPREESPFYDVKTLPKFVYEDWSRTRKTAVRPQVQLGLDFI